jgi:hypothetical protein
MPLCTLVLHNDQRTFHRESEYQRDTARGGMGNLRRARTYQADGTRDYLRAVCV